MRSCRVCRSDDLEEVVDLGNQRLSEFRDDTSQPPRFPLVLVLCRRCGLAQLSETVPPGLLYHDRYSFRSGINEAIRDDLEAVVRAAHAVAGGGGGRWLDIASNDGTLLSFVPGNYRKVGVDPLVHMAEDARRHADVIIPRFFSHGAVAEYGPFDIITSVSMFYDLDEPDHFVADVAGLLADGGTWVVQQNSLERMLRAVSVDNISHEHLTYWSVTGMDDLVRAHGLRVLAVEESEVNGGCHRLFVVCADDRRATDRSVARFRDREAAYGVADPTVFRDFERRARRQLGRLRSLVTSAVAGGRTVYVYGASTRGAVLWQAAGLDHRYLSRVVDRNPEKVGRYMSAIGAPIISEEHARAEPPHYLLVGPWWFRDRFIEREQEFLQAGGRMIIPLPELEVVRA